MSANMRSNCCEATCPFPAVGPAHPGPERQYAVVEPVVRQIWLTAEQPCGKRLAPVLRQWLPFYEGRYGQLSARQRSLIAGQPGHPGPVAGPGPGRTWAGAERDQTGQLLALRNSDSHGHLGSEPARFPGGRQRRPLRDEPGGKFHLEPDLHRHFKRLDRRRHVWNKGATGVSSRTPHRSGKTTAIGGNPAACFLRVDAGCGLICWCCEGRQ